MFTGKMDSLIGRNSRKEIAESHKRPGTARPFIVQPTLGRATLEIFLQATEDPIELSQSSRDALIFFEPCDFFCFARSGVSHQNATWSRLAPRRLPDFDRTSRKRKTIQTFFFPKSIPRLQVNTRDGIITRVLNDVLFALGDSRHFNVA